MPTVRADSPPLTAHDVARGVCRLLHHMGLATLAEVPLRNGRRADIVGIDAKGEITICEIKVSVADLRGDSKWPEYLDYCDRFFWAVPDGFPHSLLGEPGFDPAASGLIVANRFDAAMLRPALRSPLNAARRRAEILRFGRAAASRLQRQNDPFCSEG